MSYFWRDNPGWLALIVFIVMFFSMIMVINIVNKDKADVPDPKDVFTSKCIEQGGNPITKNGWDGEIYVQEYKCEGV